MIKVAQVLVLRGVDQTFDYAVGPDIAVQIGMQVDMPFGHGKAHGVVVALSEQAELGKLKYLTSVLSKKPILSEDILQLILWFGEYHQITPFKAYQTVVGNRRMRITSEKKDEVAAVSAPPYPLTVDQKTAIDTINSGKPGSEYLLYGITASGKTEVYIQIALAALTEGKKVLILLPEIALTPQIRQVFWTRFGSQVAVIHSGLTPKAREIEWNRVYAGQVQIVIGPRSALFCPLGPIGVIVIDEEHEFSYKQDQNPRYWTHVIARFRKERHGAKLVYGSATPSIETFYHAMPEVGEIQCLRLSHRAMHQPLPAVQVVDMKDEMLAGQKGMFSRLLTSLISDRLTKKEKTVILINRRGFAPYISCKSCGAVHTCDQCHLSYVYHRDRVFRCHRCLIEVPMTHICSKCQQPTLSSSGVGIQKVEMTIQKQWPAAKLYRLDRDSVKTAADIESVLKDFREAGDILIGTQLIAKGHHIEDVTLVGVLGIDTVLNIPDFRAPERAFQLITQVAGRAGRGEVPGRVVVQSFQSDHYAISHAANHDFDSFFQEEIAYREELWYPPFSCLINILITSKSQADAADYAGQVCGYLRTHTEGRQVQLLGPKPAPVEMIQTYFRWNILIKAAKEELLYVKSLLRHLPAKKASVRFILDLDPKSIL